MLQIHKIYCACVLSHFSCVWLCGMLWTAACQALLSMGFSSQEYPSGLLCPPQGDLSGPGIEPASLTSPLLAAGFFITSTTWEALKFTIHVYNQWCLAVFQTFRKYSCDFWLEDENISLNVVETKFPVEDFSSSVHNILLVSIVFLLSYQCIFRYIKYIILSFILYQDKCLVPRLRI